MNLYASRKILSGLVLLIIGSVVVYLKGDIPPNFSTFMETLFGAFVMGNAFEHYSVMKSAQGTEKKDV